MYLCTQIICKEHISLWHRVLTVPGTLIVLYTVTSLYSDLPSIVSWKEHPDNFNLWFLFSVAKAVAQILSLVNMILFIINMNIALFSVSSRFSCESSFGVLTKCVLIIEFWQAVQCSVASDGLAFQISSTAVFSWNWWTVHLHLVNLNNVDYESFSII